MNDFVPGLIMGAVLGFVCALLLFVRLDESDKIAQWGCSYYAQTLGSKAGTYVRGTGCVVGLPDGHLAIEKVPGL